MAEIIEEFYSRHQIYRAWILCGDDREALDLAADLDARHHTVACITTEDVHDEHARYATYLAHFTSTARILITSYPAWYMLQEEIEAQVLPEQNLIMFGNLEYEYRAYVERWLVDAAMRGFNSRCEHSYILDMYEEEASDSSDPDA